MMTAPGSPPCEEEVEGVVDASARRGSRKGHSSMRRQLRYWQPFNDWCGGTGCKGGGDVPWIDQKGGGSRNVVQFEAARGAGIPAILAG